MKRETKLTKKLYSEYALKEWKRLTKDSFHKLEYDTTLKFLKKYLPKKGLVLDAGGGPGRYTIELAKKGYYVVLLDITPKNLEIAKRKLKKAGIENKVKDIFEGSITNLSRFKDNTFDSVICLGGPLSHVHPEKERKKAISELIRVAKKNAPIFISVMGIYGTIMRAPYGWPQEIKMTKHFKRFYKKGDDYLWHGGKAYAHFFSRDELCNLLKNKVKIIETVGLEGLATPHQEAINKLARNKKSWKNWIDMHYKLCTHPTIVDTSLHFMIIAKKGEIKLRKKK